MVTPAAQTVPGRVRKSKKSDLLLDGVGGVEPGPKSDDSRAWWKPAKQAWNATDDGAKRAEVDVVDVHLRRRRCSRKLELQV